MDYLIYISHDAENLQFWIWLNAYSTRFYDLPASEQALSPPWSAVEGAQPTGSDSRRLPKTADKSKFGAEIHFDHPSTVPDAVQSPPFEKQSFISGIASTTKSTADCVEDANAQAGLKWQSCTSSPHLPPQFTIPC